MVRNLAAAACVALLLSMPAAPFAAPGAQARPVQKTRIALLASEHAGSVTAALDEQVEFVALVNRRLGPGESIAVVDLVKKTLLDLCFENPCIGSDQSASARTDVYQAFLLGGQGGTQVVARSNPVQVSWKNLPIDVKVTDTFGTLKTAYSKVYGRNALDELRGVPVTVTVTFPNGVSTAWKNVRVHAGPSGVLSGTPGFDADLCPIPGPCRRQVPAPPDYFHYSYSDSLANYIYVSVLDAGGDSLDWAKGDTLVTYRFWQVSLQATNKTTGQTSDAQLALLPSQTATFNATITEPKRQDLLPYMDRLEIRARNTATREGDGEVVAECRREITCSVTAQAPPGTENFVYWADVRGSDTDSLGNRPLSGRSNMVTLVPELCGSAARRPVHRPAGQSCPTTEQFTLKPGLTAADQHTTSGSFTGQGHVDVSGVMWSTRKGSNGGPDQTSCYDLEYYQTFSGLNADCNAPWPNPQPNGFEANLVMGPPGCTDQTCGWYIGGYPSLHPYDPTHTYKNVCIWGPCQEDPDGPYSLTGKVWFWAPPFGVACNVTPCAEYGGTFKITVHFS